MKKLILLFLILALTLPTAARQSANCDSSTVSQAVMEYHRTLLEGDDYAAAATLRDTLLEIGCGETTTIDNPECAMNALRHEIAPLIVTHVNNGVALYRDLVPLLAGCGSLETPVPFNIRAGTLRVNHFIRPANLLVERETAEGETTVLVGLECAADCGFEPTDFTLTDGEGTSYEAVEIVTDYAERINYDVAVAERDVAGILFIIPSAAENLRLVYQGQTAYAVQPSQDSAVIATAPETTDIHSDPGSDFPVVAVLGRESPQVVYGRNEAGTWVQTTAGWVEVANLVLDGDVFGLPVTAP